MNLIIVNGTIKKGAIHQKSHQQHQEVCREHLAQEQLKTQSKSGEETFGKPKTLTFCSGQPESGLQSVEGAKNHDDWQRDPPT